MLGRRRQLPAPRPLAGSLLCSRAGRMLDPPWLTVRSRRIRLDPEPVVHGVSEFLFTAEVTLGRLNRDVPEEELNLVEFAPGQVAESGAGAPEVVGRPSPASMPYSVYTQ